MIKTLDLITEVIRNPKNSFRKISDRPKKAEKTSLRTPQGEGVFANG
jgi:hypothetical protein